MSPAVVHVGSAAPSAWVTRFAALIPAAGRVLDLACGSGRHARWLVQRGYRVDAVDRDRGALKALQGVPRLTTRCADLEAAEWPLAGEQFDAIVVSHYLHRPHFADLLTNLAPGGVLIYETFMLGNEAFGSPRNPDFLLRPGELLERLAGDWTIVAFEQGECAVPRAAALQRVCAVRGSGQLRALP